MSHGRHKRPIRRSTAPRGKPGKAAPKMTAMTQVITAAQAALELGTALSARRSYVLQLPADPDAWPILPDGTRAVHYIALGGQVVVVRSYAQAETVRASLPTPCIAAATIPKMLRGPLYQALGLDPDDPDERDLLVFDAADDGLNPLLEAAVRWADAADAQAPRGEH